ncbi:hypothetical protein HanIR_Chr15g0779131 [Helianthus annuus]|nr:hypothetical protein HanIR_Chr15g0779131 [Helianthus annuus]
MRGLSDQNRNFQFSTRIKAQKHVCVLLLPQFHQKNSGLPFFFFFFLSVFQTRARLGSIGTLDSGDGAGKMEAGRTAGGFDGCGDGGFLIRNPAASESLL